METRTEVVTVNGAALTTVSWGDGPATIVMLHDGLGSIAQWRDVPELVAQRTGETVLAYDRRGHGVSGPPPTGPWPTDWLHQEAAVFETLLQKQEIENPYVVGHSDGGSIALLHAIDAGDSVAGVLAMAPHSWVEQVCYDSIVAMRANRKAIESGLARHHAAAAALFEAWSGVWVSEAFRRWDIRSDLAAITAPVVISQGQDDAYASPEHAILTAQAVGANGSHRLLADMGHLMHYDDAGRVVDLIVECWRIRAH